MRQLREDEKAGRKGERDGGRLEKKVESRISQGRRKSGTDEREFR